jgi:hypothetical protein
VVEKMSSSSGSLFFTGLVVILIVFQVAVTINFYLLQERMTDIIENQEWIIGKQELLIDYLVNNTETKLEGKELSKSIWEANRDQFTDEEWENIIAPTIRDEDTEYIIELLEDIYDQGS